MITLITIIVFFGGIYFINRLITPNNEEKENIVIPLIILGLMIAVPIVWENTNIKNIIFPKSPSVPVTSNKLEIPEGYELKTNYSFDGVYDFLWYYSEVPTNTEEVISKDNNTEEAGLIVIAYKDKPVYWDYDSYRFDVVYLPTMSGVKSYLEGSLADITGDGIRNLVISHFSGGKCCVNYRILSLDRRDVELIYKTESTGEYPEFIDIEDDGILEIKTYEMVFLNNNFMGKPGPEIILKFEDGKYVLAISEMTVLPPSEEKLEKLSSLFRETLTDSSLESNFFVQADIGGGKDNYELSREVIDMIYTGNGDRALEFIKESWPQDISLPDSDSEYSNLSRDKYIETLFDLLEGSHYWPQIKEMNNW